MIYFKNPQGDVFAYETEAERNQFGAPDLVKMNAAEIEAHINPVMTEEQVRDAEIAKDKAYLASTDYIVTKISEAMALGQDATPLLEQYSDDLEHRELARVRIRLNEGRA